MAFATTHIPPTGFVAGQLLDGAVFGTFDVGNFGTPPQANCKMVVKLRSYKGLLIAMAQTGNTGAYDNVETLSVRSQEYMTNLKTYPGFVNVTAFLNLLPMLATEKQLQAVGLGNNALTLAAPSGLKIPYTQDENGVVTVFIDPADTAKDQADAFKKLAQGLTGDGTTTTPGGTTDKAINWKNIIIYTVIGAVVVIGGMMAFKAMGGKKNSGKTHRY